MSANDFIGKFWEDQGRKYGTSHVASWDDKYMIDLEIAMIGKYISKGASVLDVGCGNGYSAFRQIEKTECTLTGIEFAESLYKAAVEAQAKHPKKNQIQFRRGDIRKLDMPSKSMDVVYTTRVLINLPTWEEQVLGIEECLRVTKPGGTVVFAEAFWEPLCRLNALRMFAGLPNLVEHDFNRYLKVSRFEQFLTSKGLRFVEEDFSSLFYLGSRFIRELITEPDRVQGFENPFNSEFLKLAKEYTVKGFGIQKGYAVTV